MLDWREIDVRMMWDWCENDVRLEYDMLTICDVRLKYDMTTIYDVRLKHDMIMIYDVRLKKDVLSIYDMNDECYNVWICKYHVWDSICDVVMISWGLYVLGWIHMLIKWRSFMKCKMENVL